MITNNQQYAGDSDQDGGATNLEERNGLKGNIKEHTVNCLQINCSGRLSYTGIALNCNANSSEIHNKQSPMFQ